MTDIAGIDVARIEIRLAEASVRTHKGATLENPVTLVNLTPLPDFFYLAVSGIPAPWAVFDKESVNLFPNWSDVVNLTLTVPPETQPGRYTLEIEVSSRTQDNVRSGIRLEIFVENATTGPVAPPAPITTAQRPALDLPPASAAASADLLPADFQRQQPPPEFPRLQLDLDFGQVAVPGGQTAEQVAHLLNLSGSPQNLSIGLEGLPPEWTTVQPPALSLFPGWSETAHLAIAVPPDAVPGRYLVAVQAFQPAIPEATVWRQFDFVILPPTQPSAPPQPSAPETAAPVPTSKETTEIPAATAVPPETVAPSSLQPEKTVNPPVERPKSDINKAQSRLSQPEILAEPQKAPVAPAPSQPEVASSVVGPATSPKQPAVLSLTSAPEAYKAETKPKGGLFGWRKKKTEPVPPEPLLFVPVAPAPPVLTTPVPLEPATLPLPPAPESPALPANEPVAALPATPEINPALEDPPTIQVAPTAPSEANAVDTLSPVKDRPQPEAVSPVAIETLPVLPASTEAVLPPTTPVSPVETTSPEVNDSIADPATAPAPLQSWRKNLGLPLAADGNKEKEAEVNPVLDDVAATLPPPVLEAAPAQTQTLSNPAGEVEAAEADTAETPEVAGPPPEPARLRTANFELTVENIKIRFELGTAAEQQVGLLNLMSNPAFFDLKVEGLPEIWYNFSYSQINLFPNWKEEVYFRVEAPTDTAPGVFAANLVVTSPSLPDEKVELPLEIEVLPSAVLADKLYRATGSGQPLTMPADAHVELALDNLNLTLTSGEALEQTVSIVNHSPIPDLFELKLDGLLDSWYQFSTPLINLFPNWREELYLRIALPDNAVAGLYPVRLLVKAKNYSELNTEQTLLLQVLPPAPKTETEAELNPVLGDADTADYSKVSADDPAQTTSAAEEAAPAPAQPFSFASFFQQQNLVPGAVAQNPTPAPAASLPVVPPTPEAVYNQPTSAYSPSPQPQPAPGPYPPPSGDPFEKRPTAKLGQQSVIAPQASLAGIIPALSAQPEASAPAPVEPVYAPIAAPPPKRTFVQRLFGQNKQSQPSQATPKIDENVLWRPAQPPAPNKAAPNKSQGKGQNQAAPVAYTSAPVSAQATQANYSAFGNQATPPGGYQAINIPAQPAPANQRAYAPMSAGGEVARVQITLEKPHITIVAGNSATQQVFLMNLTSLPDNFDLTIEGLPATWFSFESATVNLFPNWNEHTALTVNISDKVKPDLYKGRIAVAASAQNGVRAVMPIEIEVLAPLVVQARLQPHRGKGYRARYEMLLRNRSMSEGLMTMQWAPTNEYSTGTFDPPTVVLAPGQSQHVKLQVMLRKKTPSDQARQAQPFRVLVQPQWTVAQTPVLTAPVGVEGEYIHRSRWVFIQRHPILFTFLIIVLAIVLLWNLLLLPFIQNTLMALSLDKVSYSDVAAKTLAADQLGFNTRLKEANPLAALVPTDVSFVEAQDKNAKGVVTVRMQAFVFTATMTGTLQVDPISGNLQFVADKKSQLGSFPWFFVPPDKVVQRLSAKLKTWLKQQSPPQRLDDVYIEGNTIFLKLKNCQTGEVACR